MTPILLNEQIPRFEFSHEEDRDWAKSRLN